MLKQVQHIFGRFPLDIQMADHGGGVSSLMRN